VRAAAAAAVAVAATPAPAPTATSFPPVSAPLRSQPPHVAPRIVALVDDAASTAAAAPARRVARCLAVAARWSPRSGVSIRAVAASAGGVVMPRLASAGAVGAASGSPSMAGGMGGGGGGGRGGGRGILL